MSNVTPNTFQAGAWPEWNEAAEEGEFVPHSVVQSNKRTIHTKVKAVVPEIDPSAADSLSYNDEIRDTYGPQGARE